MKLILIAASLLALSFTADATRGRADRSGCHKRHRGARQFHIAPRPAKRVKTQASGTQGNHGLIMTVGTASAVAVSGDA